jgi:17beta-estradiol 17-dehydrogenase / very-long-chain 3-oxoacyl-CoA reductase
MNTKKPLIFGVFTYFTYDFWFDIHKKNWVEVPDHSKTYGANSWALVTGATDGLGKSFAEKLASQGFNMILISRSRSNLDIIANQLKNRFSVETLVFPMDLSTAGKKEFSDLTEITKNHDVSIIVNNAGQMSITPTINIQSHHIDSNLNLHCLAVAWMMKIFISRFKKREKRSAIINVSSIVALRPYPVLSLYSSTKAFNYYLTAGLAHELKEKIDVLSYLAGPLRTRMLLNQNAPLVIDTDTAVDECLKDLGIKNVSYGHWKHTLLAFLIQLTPMPVRMRLFGMITRNDIGISSFPGF